MTELRNLIQIGGLTINLYGIVFASAFIALFFLARNFLSRKNKNPNLAYSAVIYSALGMLVFARLFYVVFYAPSYFLSNPLEIFAVWTGGLSFYGGLLGVSLFGLIFCRKNKISFLEIADFIAIPALFFFIIGRVANFLNGEIPGIDSFPVPLYDALKNAVILITLVIIKQKPRKQGIVFLTFVFLYSFLRIFVDFFRADGLLASQILNLTACIVSAYFLIRTISK